MPETMQSKSNEQYPKLVAIVVPLSNRDNLTADEEISLRHLRHHLGSYDKFAVLPEGLDFRLDGFESARFPGMYFGSISAHQRLLFSRLYYETFSDYEYILTYHLDALVFSDQLVEWCRRGFDFIGPPWVKHEDTPYAGDPAYEGKVGNSGFCLKKVANFMNVFDSKKRAITNREYWNQYFRGRGLPHLISNAPKLLAMQFNHFNNAVWEMQRWPRNEEPFIVERAGYYYPPFNIAPFNDALRFGFECAPRHCYELNGNTLPFGCHAWERYDRDFWEEFLLP